MGRGRQKAKQTKVARALKYYSPETDYARLQRELQGEPGSNALPGVTEDFSDGYDDSDGDDYGDWAPPRR